MMGEELIYILNRLANVVILLGVKFLYYLRLLVKQTFGFHYVKPMLPLKFFVDELVCFTVWLLEVLMLFSQVWLLNCLS